MSTAIVSNVLGSLRPVLRTIRNGPDEIDLSRRDKEILAGLVEGAPNKVIARRLGVTDGTIKVGVKMLLRKLDLQNRTQAAVWAFHRGLEAPQDAGD